MLNIGFYKAAPTTYVVRYHKGVIKQQGVGLSFFYYAPNTSLVAIPIASQDAPFMLKEATADFQEVTIQGQVVFRVANAERLAGMMNFALTENAKEYASKDPEKLANRILNLVQVLMRAEIQQLPLRSALTASRALVERVREQLKSSDVLTSLGVEVVDLAIQAIRPAPETSRALEAAVREALLKEADDATYSRRNAAIEQERSIKENELKTELAIEAKTRELRESKMEAERSVKEKERLILKEDMDAQVDLETKRQELVELATLNERKQSEAKAYAIEKMMDALNRIDPKLFDAIAAGGMEPEVIIAQAFKTLAGNTGKVGQLNITPDFLGGLLQKDM
jgi:regulator of protease activity HflC (stomatin/prohibitin superfamily)